MATKASRPAESLFMSPLQGHEPARRLSEGTSHMDIQKFTERSQGFLQAAGTIAIREFHQRITPEHLLKALLDDEEGAAAGLIKAAGGDPKAAAAANDAEVAKQPKVTGGGAGQPSLTPELVRVLDAAQQAATKA